MTKSRTETTFLKTAAIVLVALSFGIFLAASLKMDAEAHNRTLSKKDGCHKQSGSVERHGHWDRDPSNPVVAICNPDGTFTPITVTKNTEKIVEVERVIDPAPELWERVWSAERERKLAVDSKMSAVNQARKDRQIANLAKQDQANAEYKMEQYNRRMMDMESGAPPCGRDRQYARDIIDLNPWGYGKEMDALLRVLYCLEIGL